MVVLISVCLALMLDILVGELRRYHPLVGFGRYADFLELKINVATATKLNAIYALVLATFPIVGFATLIQLLIDGLIVFEIIVSSLFLYLAVGWRSLQEHAIAVARPLAAETLNEKQLGEARTQVAKLVSRETQQLDREQISRAATESVLENGADAIFSALFWYLLAGIPGLVLYRLVNTLDAMWGYKNDRFVEFGWAAARLDDLMNYIPARLTALSYALMGNTRKAIHCWRKQSRNWKSSNAGAVMASGAGAINVRLGGEASYEGVPQTRPVLGPSDADPASSKSIDRACDLVNRSLLLWIFIIAAYDLYVL